MKPSVSAVVVAGMYFFGALQAAPESAASYLDTRSSEAVFASIDVIEQQKGAEYADQVRTGILFFLSKGLATHSVSKALRDKAGQKEAIESARAQTLTVLSQIPVETLVSYAAEREPALMAEIREYARNQVVELSEHKQRWEHTQAFFDGLQVELQDVRIHSDRFGYQIPEIVLSLNVPDDRWIGHADFDLRLDANVGELSERYTRELALAGPISSHPHAFDLNPLGLMGLQVLGDPGLGPQIDVEVTAIYTKTETGDPIRLSRREPFTAIHQERLDRMVKLQEAETLLSVYTE